MRIVFAAVFALAAQDADRIKGAVAKYGQREYSVTVQGKKVGSLALESKVDGDTAVFKDVVTFEDGGKSHRFAITVTCALDASFTTRGVDLQRGEETLKAEVKEGKLTVGGKVTELKRVPLAGYSIFRKIALLEAKEGASFEFDNIGFDGLRLETGARIAFTEKKKITRAGKEVEAAVWTMTTPGHPEAEVFVVDGLIVSIETDEAIFDLVDKK